MIDYRLLGPIEAGINGHALEIGGQKQRALLTILLFSANEPVSREVLIDRLWGGCPPAGAQHTLEVYISRLRTTLKSAADEAVVLTRSGAYLLPVPSERIDIGRFERLAGEGRGALAAGAPGQAAAFLGEALALWRGAPLAEVSDELFAHGVPSRSRSRSGTAAGSGPGTWYCWPPCPARTRSPSTCSRWWTGRWCCSSGWA